MITVIDNVLTEEERIPVADYYRVKENSERGFQWFDKKINDGVNENHFISKLLNLAHKCISLNEMVGFETWSHYNVAPKWHYDKDEFIYQSTNKIVYPICSIVYYPLVEDLVGGKFLTKTESITPVTNRMLCFGPGIYHTVEEFTGTRITVAVSPWQYHVKYQ